MDKESLILLTGKLYKITLFFPKKEPLRRKMQEIATAVLEDFIRLSFVRNFKSAEVGLLSSLEVLDGFFEVVKSQNWVKELDILAIQQEYANFKASIQQENFDKISESDQQLKLPESLNSGELNHLTGFVPEFITANSDQEIIKEKVNPRQRTILDFLKENGRVQVWQIKEIFPEISKRTLRRDFEYMLKQGIIERIGQRNSTFYQIR